MFADSYSIKRPDSHAPIGVMADHKHHKNEIMLSFRSMPMTMSTLVDGKETQSVDNIHSSYMKSPKDMTMTMHMVGAMWGYSNQVTLTAMLGYSDNKMTMVDKMSKTSNMASSGLNDVKLGAIIDLDKSINSKTIANIGLAYPLAPSKKKMQPACIYHMEYS